MVSERKWKSALPLRCGPDVGLRFDTCLNFIFETIGCVYVRDFLRRISLQKPIFLTLINNTLKAQSSWNPTTDFLRRIIDISLYWLNSRHFLNFGQIRG